MSDVAATRAPAAEPAAVEPALSEADTSLTEEHLKGDAPATAASSWSVWGLVSGAASAVTGLVTGAATAPVETVSGLVAGAAHVATAPVSTVTELVSHATNAPMAVASNVLAAPVVMASKMGDSSKAVYDKSLSLAAYMSDGTKATFDGSINLAAKIGSIPHYTIDQSLALASALGDASKQTFDNVLAGATATGDTIKSAFDGGLEVVTDAQQRALSGEGVPTVGTVVDIARESTTKVAGLTASVVKDAVAGTTQVTVRGAEIAVDCGKHLMDESITLAAKAGGSTKEIFDTTVGITSAVTGMSMYNNAVADVVVSSVELPTHMVTDSVTIAAAVATATPVELLTESPSKREPAQAEASPLASEDKVA